jgi:3-isopropylmalate dehydrogenase
LKVVTVLPGDGIGPEVVEATLSTLEALDAPLSFDVLDHVNASAYRRSGHALTDGDLARITSGSAVLLGAFGDPVLEDTDYVRSVLLRLRLEFDLYANYRPARLWQDRLSPLRDPSKRAVDCVIVRENTEGLYSGVGGALRAATPWETTVDADISTYHGVSRIIDFAFSVAAEKVCMVDKANAVRSGGGLWQRCWREAAERHPDKRASHLYVDAAAMKLVTDPTEFEVVVTNNSYGDILSDLTAALAGGLGLAASASLNPETGFGLYEPVHGTAPDIAGKGIANPLATVLTAALLYERLELTAEADALRRAVTAAIAKGRVTPDLGGDLSTREAAAAVRAEL